MFVFRSPHRRTRGEGNLAYDYAKVILYAYPHLHALAEASAVAAENKALLSFRSRRGALEEAERIAEELAVRSRLLRLEKAVEELLAQCSREELFLLEYRYFRRRRRLDAFGGYVVPCSERTYFRRQSALLKKAACCFAACGWTEEAYFAAFAGYSLFARILRAIRDGRESAVAARREQCGLAFSGRQNSCCSRGGFLPRSKMTATATAATQASTMTTICTAFAGVPSAEGSPVSPETEER